MLSDEMKEIITQYPAGMVATINADGTPSVSPKATFVILDDNTLAFGNIRSPGTIRNLYANPNLEINFIDVITRRAVRVTGTGNLVSKKQADDAVMAAFEKSWGDYLPYMLSFVQINVSRAEMIYSPAYDLGITKEALKSANLAKLNAL